MKKGFTSPFIAASAAVLMGTVAGAQGGAVAVNIRPAAPFDVVIFSAANAGKVVAHTDEKGKGRIDAASLANLGKVAVYEEKCDDGTRVALVAEGSAPDPKCKNRRVGAFWFGHDSALDVRLSGGASTGVKAGLIAGGAGAAALVALKGGSSNNQQTGQVVTPQVPTSPTSPGTTPTPTPTPPTTPTVSSLYGTFNMSATKTSDSGCNFNQVFTGQVQISGNTDGSRVVVSVMERLSRTYSGSMQSNGMFSASGSGNLDGYAYSGQISGQVSGNSVQATEVLYFSSGCPGKQVVYRISGSK
jgi:hypothetical protein